MKNWIDMSCSSGLQIVKKYSSCVLTIILIQHFILYTCFNFPLSYDYPHVDCFVCVKKNKNMILKGQHICSFQQKTGVFAMYKVVPSPFRSHLIILVGIEKRQIFTLESFLPSTFIPVFKIQLVNACVLSLCVFLIHGSFSR